MAFEKIDLHDALIRGMNIDHARKTVTIEVHFYKTANDKNRAPASIIFEKVESLSQIVDFERLEKNSFAGTISYWAPSQAGTTFIYLADGCIAINSGEMSFQESISATSM